MPSLILNLSSAYGYIKVRAADGAYLYQDNISRSIFFTCL